MVSTNMITNTVLLLLLSITHSAWSGKFKCPAYTTLADKAFVFPDPAQCDKYWTCQGGQSRRSLCPDGLVFHPGKEEGEDPCDLKHNVPDKCEGRSELQRAKPGDAHCPRQNGVYASTVPGECDTYYSCLNGKSSPTKCAPGLHYSDDIGTCVWPRESGRDNCEAAPAPTQRKTPRPNTNTGVTTSRTVETLANGFRCPGGKIGVHPALPHPTDCQLYYVCLDGVTPSEAGCVRGKVFNPVTKRCDRPENVEGCEYYYNPQLKKQKEEEKKKIATNLGTDVSNNDFSQFLKLLKMSGVLTSDGESLIQSTLGKQAAGLGGGVGGGRPRRPGRPRGLGGRRKKPRRRPTTPRPEYDYYYDDYEEFTEQEAVESPRKSQDDLKNSVRAPSIKSVRKEDNSQSEQEKTDSLPASGKSSLFAVPENRKFASRFVRVRPLGNPINRPRPVINSEVKLPEPIVKSSPPTTTKTTTQAAVIKVTEPPPEMALSGQEADDLFNSLFPTIGDGGDAVANTRPVTTPVKTTTTTESTTSTTTESPTELPRSPLFSRPRNKLRLRITKPKLVVPDKKNEDVDNKGSDNEQDDDNVDRPSPFPFRNRFRGKTSFLNKNLPETSREEVEIATSRPQPVVSVTRRINQFAPTPVSIPDSVDTDIQNNLVESPSPRQFKKFVPRKSFRALIAANRNRNQLISSSPVSTTTTTAPTTTKTTTVSTTTSTTTTSTTSTTTTSPTTTTSTTTPPPPPTTTTLSSLSLIPTRSNSPFTFFRSLTSSSTETPAPAPQVPNFQPVAAPQSVPAFQPAPAAPASQPIPALPPVLQLQTSTQPPAALQNFVPTRSPNVTPFTFFNSPFQSLFSNQPQQSQASVNRGLPPVEPAFLSIPSVNVQPSTTTPQPPQFAPQPPQDTFTSFRARSQPQPAFSSSLSRAPTSFEAAPTPAPVVSFSFGRPSPTSVSIEEDPQHLRMMTQRARVQIKNFLPRAENEGDAIEMLRLKVETFQNRNRARG